MQLKKEETMSTINWAQISNISSRKYVCGHCNNSLASNIGYAGHDANNPRISLNTFIYICHHCNKPTFFDVLGNQTPGTTYGEEVSDIISHEVAYLYNEARNCMGHQSYTAVVLCCRKLLMHIAVSKGAKEGLSFFEYVEYLSNQNYIPPDAKEWVDHIRKKGNEANHEISIMKTEDAKDLIDFIGMLLKIIYQFPAAVKKRTFVVKET